MIFDTSQPLPRKKAIERVKYLLSKGAKIEVLEKKKKRTYSQNNYLHLILGWFALDYGETTEYVKQEMFKKMVNAEIFKTEYVNEKTGEIRDHWRSTRELTTDEMTTAIERFRNWSAVKKGFYLPEAKDVALLEEIQNELEKHSNKIYL